MKLFKTLGRGVHPPHRKSTADIATTTMPLPEKIYLPMQQHIGAPCKPCVAKGDAVLVGTVVGKAAGYVGADIHSGVSGTVSAVERMTAANGSPVETVVITADGQQTVDAALAPPAVRDRESFLAAVRASGLVGLGGAGFPTSVKLAPKNPDDINTLIINAAECEPYITADCREMLECGDTVISGIMAVKKYLGIPRVAIAIERNKPEAIDLMFSLVRGDGDLSVVPLTARYPQGAEKVLIQTVTGQEVPAGGLPADAGVLVLNVATVSAIGKYLASGLPLMTKRVTVDGGAVVEPKNVEAIIGTPIADVVEFCGGFKTPPAKVLMGGPMMGLAMTDLSFPILKTSNAVLTLTAEEAEVPPPEPCIRCARCVQACPMRLSPVELCEAYEARDIELLAKLSADVCMNCGVCSYVCPARRLLSPSAALGRLAVLAAQKEAKK